MYLTSPAFRRATPGYRSILIIGDVLAEGIGDSIAQGGLAVRLNRLVCNPHNQTSLRLSWSVVTTGRLHTTSADWLPVAADRDASQDKSSLFYRSVAAGLFRSADIVVVLLGAHDEHHRSESSGRTVENIVRIADASARLGKHVLVASIPCFQGMDTDVAQSYRTQNAALKVAVDALQSNKYEGGSVTLGVDVQRVLARGQDVLREEKYFTTLNSYGYRAFARDVLDALAPIATKVEWEYFKAQLTPRYTSASHSHREGCAATNPQVS
jgi:hypothetical protein